MATGGKKQAVKEAEQRLALQGTKHGGVCAFKLMREILGTYIT